MFGAMHAKRYAERMTAYLGLDVRSHVIEVASSDGFLLQHFSKLGIPVIGIEPDHAAAALATKARGVPTLTGSFGRTMARSLAAEGIDADLVVANNALSRMADADDLLAGLALLLNREGVATVEIAPSSGLTPRMAEQLLAANGLRIFDVEPLGTSLQLFVCLSDSAWEGAPGIGRTLAAERPPVH